MLRATLLSFTHSGDKGIRTLDPLLARQVLSQLSYTPMFRNGFILLYILSYIVGLNGLEPSTSRLSGVRSNQLSYNPVFNLAATYFPIPSPV